MADPLDARIAALAAGQHGVVSTAQLLGLGLSRAAIHRRLAAGRLHRLHRGVFAVGHPSVSPRGRLLAAVLACGPRAVLHVANTGVALRASAPVGPPDGPLRS